MNSNPASDIASGLTPEKLPKHVAIIMDGNGRWAKQRLFNRMKGHEKGSDTVRDIVRASREIGISYLTLYAFSTENWRRPKSEISALMMLLKRFLESERGEMVETDIRFNTIGQVHRLPEDVQQAISVTREATAKNVSMTLTLALSYGGRSEIVEMAGNIAEQVRSGCLDPKEITEEFVAGQMYTADLPDPDVVIRTSGEMRLSNFLLWQIAYAEIFVTNTLWPDFTREEFFQILKHYQERERRFGKV